jgi:hypothetical protein
MKVWMLWHGGTNYAAGYIEDDIEAFDSIKECERSFDRRADSWNTYYPCVERDPAENGGQSAWLFFYDPNDEANGVRDPYPDQILEYGPRGGLRRTPA